MAGIDYIVVNDTDYLVDDNQNNIVAPSGNRYLQLVNEALRHFNEVGLTTSNFASVTGFQATVKDYVNDAIKAIQQAEYEWPFNWVATTVVLNPDQADPQLYALDPDLISIDWESFSLVRDDVLSVAETHLPYIDYDEWYQNYRANDKAQVDSTSLGVQVPRLIFRTQDGKFGVTPIPDRAYTVRYEGWAYEDSLSDYDDDTTVPERYNNVIKDGTISLCYAFRQNEPLRQMYYKKFIDGINKMRELLINRYKKVRDNRVKR